MNWLNATLLFNSFVNVQIAELLGRGHAGGNLVVVEDDPVTVVLLDVTDVMARVV